MNVLVMGGTQFNGLALVHELARHGHDVTIVNRGKTEAPLPGGVHRLIADRTDHDAVRAALGGREFDCVFDVNAYQLADVELMADILHGRTGHYVFIGSTVIYAAADLLPITEGHPVDRSERQNEYGLNKLLCEDFLIRQYRERGFPASIVALSMSFGPRNILPDREQRMFARLLQGRPILIPGDGSILSQVGHVDDQARALRLMVGNPQTFGRRYNLTGVDFFSADGYVDTFASVVGEPANKVYVPASVMDAVYDGEVSVRLARSEVKVDTRPSRRLDGLSAVRSQLATLVEQTAPHINRWNRSVVYSVDRMRRDMGWEPEYTFPAAVAQTYEWFRREGLDQTLEFDFTFEDEILRLTSEAR